MAKKKSHKISYLICSDNTFFTFEIILLKIAFVLIFRCNSGVMLKSNQLSPAEIIGT